MARVSKNKLQDVTPELSNAGANRRLSRAEKYNRLERNKFEKGNQAATLKPMSEEQALAKIAKFPNRDHWPKRRITECFHRQLDEIVDVRGVQMRAEEAIARQVMDKAIAGDLGAFDRIIDRVEGRPNQSLEVSGPDKGPIKSVSVTMTMQEMASFYARSVVDEDAVDVMSEEV